MERPLKASIATLLLLLMACAQAQQVAKTNSKTNETGATITSNQASGNLAMPGAYAMLMQIMNDGNRDSILNVQQFKIYTDRHFMYAHALPGDSLAYYGVGTYRIDNGR